MKIILFVVSFWLTILPTANAMKLDLQKWTPIITTNQAKVWYNRRNFSYHETVKKDKDSVVINTELCFFSPSDDMYFISQIECLPFDNQITFLTRTVYDSNSDEELEYLVYSPPQVQYATKGTLSDDIVNELYLAALTMD